MDRALVEDRGRGPLDDLAQVHDRDPVRDVAHDTEIVRDEDVGEVELVLEVVEQVDDLGLDGDVQGRDRLVGDDQLRAQREGPGDPDPLALPARELVRKAVVVLGLKPDPVHQLLDLPAELRPGGEPVQAQLVPDDLPHPLARVERGIGVLEDHLDVAPDRLQLLAREADELLAQILHRPRGWLEQLDDRAAEGRLATARLADEAQGLALVQRQADVVDGVDGSPPPARSGAPP